MLSYPEGTRYTVLTPIRLREDRTLQQQLEIDLKQGFNRIEVNGEMKRIDEYTPVAGDEVYLVPSGYESMQLTMSSVECFFTSCPLMGLYVFPTREYNRRRYS